MKRFSRTIFVSILFPLILLGCCFAKKEVVKEDIKMESESVNSGEVYKEIQVHLSDTITSSGSEESEAAEWGVVDICRDSVGNPKKIIWRRSGETKVISRMKDRSDRWFEGLNATRSSEAKKENGKKQHFGRTEIREQPMPTWKAWILPGVLIFLFGAAWFATKGGKDE